MKRYSHDLLMSLSPREIFSSTAYRNHLENLKHMLLSKAGVDPRLLIIEGEEASSTSGDIITINIDDQDAHYYEDKASMVAAMDAVLFHECAHILFYDFDKVREKKEGFIKGLLPATINVEEKDEKKLALLEEMMLDFRLRRTLLGIFQTIDNIVADSHDEKRLMERYPGYVTTSLTLMQTAMWQQVLSEEDLVGKGREDLSILFSLLLTYARFSRIPVKDENHKDKFLSFMDSVKPFIDEAVLTDTYEVKAEMIVRCLMEILTFIKVEQGKDIPRMSDDQKRSFARQMEKALDTAEGDMKEQSAPTDRSTLKEEGASFIPGDKPKEEMTLTQAEKLLENALSEIEEEAREQELVLSEQREIKEIAMLGDIEELEVHNTYSFSVEEKREYERIKDRLSGPIKKTVRKVKEKIKEDKEREVQRHRAFGNGMNLKEAYRVDEKYFIKKKADTNVPKLAVSILIDESGSMGGERIEKAMEAAVALTEVSEALEFPLSIAGHSTMGNVQYNLYKDFDSHKDKKASIVHMLPGGGNRDGDALLITMERLAKRREEKKLLFLISDGRPSAYRSREEGLEHIREVLKKAKRKHVEVIAVAISDFESIKEIYQEAYFELKDLEMLPVKMVKLLQKRIFT